MIQSFETWLEGEIIDSKSTFKMQPIDKFAHSNA